MILALLATFACVAATAALVAAERAISQGRAGETTRRPAKLCASAAFVAAALLAGACQWRYGRWVATGLAFGALGDAALLVRKRRGFVAGMALFAVDHVCVLRASILVVAPGAWSAVWLLVPAGVAAAVLIRLWPNLGLLRVPVALYTALLAAMLTAAVGPLLAGPPAWFGLRRAALLAGGALAFFASDLAVARQRFAHESFWNKACGLPLYFGGQLLIAWSAAA